MDAGLDTGAMLLAESIKVGAGETAGELHDRLATLGARLIVAALAQHDALTPVAQPASGVTYAAKISKAEASLDWAQPADVLVRKIHAFNPFPGATLDLAGETVKIWRAQAVAGSGNPGQILAANTEGIVIAAGHGALSLIELQKPGGRRITSAEFLRGKPLIS